MNVKINETYFQRFLRQSNSVEIYRKTGNLLAVQLLLGYTVSADATPRVEMYFMAGFLSSPVENYFARLTGFHDGKSFLEIAYR